MGKRNILMDRAFAGFSICHRVVWLDERESTRLVLRLRNSAETSYLREALAETTNLQIYKSTTAKEILFDGSKRATGIRVNSGGFEYQRT